MILKVLPCRGGTGGQSVTKQGAVLRRSIRGSCCNGYIMIEGLVNAVLTSIMKTNAKDSFIFVCCDLYDL